MQTLIQFIKLLISGVSSAFLLLTSLFSILLTSLAMIPPYLTSVLILGFGIIVAIRVLELLP